ncbi:glycoside hydrolase family 13 protein [Polychaeton citri CBS 116435]|uniref:Glycoside hydrolase family 13 protein n=1 Tax=Polychaeton citri CBS 116435 TaxID=1314669 RepID=A0A9P4PYF1_9PEZI|nr:glycoside hydrolase family 13 protein [Polychaeton citri CBS 116435]
MKKMLVGNEGGKSRAIKVFPERGDMNSGGMASCIENKTPQNELLFQTFEWYTSSTPPAPNETYSPHSHYAQLLRSLPSLAKLGVTSVWLPPGCKANNPQGNGYDCYDIWDLGEFDQKWARSTKWGSREELHDLLGKAHELGVECIWDAVLNHKTAGDATDEAWAVEVDSQGKHPYQQINRDFITNLTNQDRRREICQPLRVEAWLKYDFPGRGDRYSSMKWRAEHFNGTDWDQRREKNAIYKLIDDPATLPKPGKEDAIHPSHPHSGVSGMNRLAKLANKFTSPPVPPRRPGKGWADDVDDLFGNFDYLMFSNIDYTHPEVRDDVVKWGNWMINETGVDGFRLDAVQHFSFAFTRHWIDQIQQASLQKRGKSAFVVGEIWTGEVKRIVRWLDQVSTPSIPVHAYDSPLVYNFSRISEDVRTGSKNSDLRTILRDSLVSSRPHQAVTLVTNHDTQPGQASYVPINPTMKSLFYAFILLRREGVPCVFWGDLYGTKGPRAEPPSCTTFNGMRTLLPDLMLARKYFAYGDQREYFDSSSCVGFTRAGTHDRLGCAVVMSIVNPQLANTKKMTVGSPGETWVDIMGNAEAVVIDRKGVGAFIARGMSVSVYVKKKDWTLDIFPEAAAAVKS